MPFALVAGYLLVVGLISASWKSYFRCGILWPQLHLNPHISHHLLLSEIDYKPRLFSRFQIKKVHRKIPSYGQLFLCWMSKKRYAYNSLCPRREVQQKHTERVFGSSVSDLKSLIINSDNLCLLFTKWSHRRAVRLFLYRTNAARPRRRKLAIWCATLHKVVEDLIGSQPLGYRFLFCKTPPSWPITSSAE